MLSIQEAPEVDVIDFAENDDRNAENADQENNNINNNNNNNNVPEVHPDAQNAAAAEIAAANNNNAQNINAPAANPPVNAPVQANQRAGGRNNDELNWNIEWDRAAEELTWERLLGLDGSLVFLEHVFWVVSLNTLFILLFGQISTTSSHVWLRLNFAH